MVRSVHRNGERKADRFLPCSESIEHQTPVETET